MRFRVAIGLFGVVVIVLLAMAIATCLVARGPRMQKVADCTNSTLRVELSVATDRNYNFVIAIPQSRSGHLSFGGEIEISKGTQSRAISISSQDITPCDGVKQMDCYLLTWSPTNRSKVNDFMIRGQKYDLTIQFSEMPPQGSSIWLRSLGRVCPGFP